MGAGRRAVRALGAAACVLVAGASAPARAADAPPPPASQVDAFVARPRVLVLTDIANEPDDQMSLVRFLVYANEWDVEGLVATTSTWMRSTVRPDAIRAVLDAYERVQPNLLRHAPGFPPASALRAVVAAGQDGFGMDAVGVGRDSEGARLLARAAEKADPRPLWVLAWGGTNTLAQALTTLRATRTPGQMEAIVRRLRVYAISDQDDAGPWLRRTFPDLHYIASPATRNGEEYYLATWTGISGDRFYRNAPGADFTTFTDEWVNAHIRSKGPLGALYLYPCCIHEGDTPSFLGLVDNGLASAMSPAFGGWGGRYVWRQPSGETRPFWTQGGDSYPGNDSSRDTVVGSDGQEYTSDQATIWRWRAAFQNDFAARMDWTVKEPREANHNPRAVVNGRAGTEPLVLEATVGVPLTLDAAGSSDPDGDALEFAWFYYPEAGSGIPGHPVLVRRHPPSAAPGQGGIPPAPRGGPPPLPPRLVLQGASVAGVTVVPQAEGIAHVILRVQDSGTPPLTSYRRVILDMKPAAAGVVAAADAPSRVALTFDDLPAHGMLPPGLSRADVTRGILAALAAHHAPATYGFLNAKGLAESADNAAVPRLWREAGHPLGNHTFSHLDLNTNTAEAFEQDVIANEPALRAAMGESGWRWLRYPYLDQGETPEKREAVAAFLKERGYRVADVTVSFDDWAYNDAYARCMEKGDGVALAWLAATFMERAEASLAAARTEARHTCGRDIAHVMLLHVGGFTSNMLPRLLDLVERRGFRLVTLDEAEADPVYAAGLDRACPSSVPPQWPAPTGPPDPKPRLQALCR